MTTFRNLNFAIIHRLREQLLLSNRFNLIAILILIIILKKLLSFKLRCVIYLNGLFFRVWGIMICLR